MAIEFRVTEKRWMYHFLNGRRVPKWIIRSGPNSYSFRAFMPVLVTCKFDKYLVKGDWEKLEISVFFATQEHVTPNRLVRSDRNLNPSNISCLSLLPVSLMKIEFIVTEKKWRLHFLHYKSMGKLLPLRANNLKVSIPIRSKFELYRVFMSVLVTCKFDKDPIKGDWETLETSFFSPLKGT